MAPKSRSGRATAEAAYAALMKEQTRLVGEVGATFEAYTAKVAAAAEARDAYEAARASAIKAGAINAEQLDQIGYKKTPRIAALKDSATPPSKPPAPSAPPIPVGDPPAATPEQEY